MRAGISAILLIIVVAGILFASPIAISEGAPNAGLASSQSPHDPIRIDGDAEFTGENGVVSGSGTPSEPYVIEGWVVNASAMNGIEIRATTAHFVIRNVVILAGPFGWIGVFLEGAANGKVESVEFIGTQGGIALHEAVNISLTNNRFVSNGEWSIYSEGSSNIYISGNRLSVSSGILLFNSTTLHVAGNLVNSTGEAIIIIESSNITLESNSVWDSELAFQLVGVSNATVRTNNVWDNRLGLILQESRNVIFEANAFIGSGINLEGHEPEHFVTHEISRGNSVNGRPVYFYKDCSDEVLEDVPAGQIFVVGCVRVQINDVQLIDVDVGIQIAFAEDLTLSGVNVSNAWRGIRAVRSRNISVQNSTLWSNDVGFSISDSDNVTLTDSRISMNSEAGGRLSRSANVTITRNTFSYNYVGVSLFEGVGPARILHNDFIDNLEHGRVQDGSGTPWDGGYPDGGNYWSDYEGEDICSGPGQDSCPDPDGFGDTEYVIYRFYPYNDIRDRYPLIEPVDPRNARPEVAAPLSTYLILAVTVTGVAFVATILLLWYRRTSGRKVE